MTHRMSWALALSLGRPGVAPAHKLTKGWNTEAGHWQAQTSLYTRHFSPDPEHNNRQDLIGLERHRGDGMLLGGATFRNSFSQRSTYLYLGRQFPLGVSPFHLKLTGGLLHGYRGEHWDKIPLNRYGVAPAILPSAGVTHGRFVGEVIMVGTAATMITAGVRF